MENKNQFKKSNAIKKYLIYLINFYVALKPFHEFFLKFVIVVFFEPKFTFTFIRPFFFGIYFISILVLLFVV
jgi:hypothetical protein